MKVLNANEVELDECLRAAQKERIVVTQRGKPVAVVLGTKGADMERLEFGMNPAFWKMIRKRRKEKTISHEELERRLAKWEKAGI